MDIDDANAKEIFYQCGYEDYVHSDSKVLSLEGLGVKNGALPPPFPAETLTQREEWYTEGWNDAKAQERKRGSIVFLLTELKKRMDEGGEWSGDDFDKPVAMLSKVLRHLGYDETPRNPSLPPEPGEASKRLARIVNSPETGELSDNVVPYTYATSSMHLFVPRDGAKYHTYTGIGIIVLPERNIVIQHDFEGTDRDALEQAMKQWCQYFHDVLCYAEIRVIDVNKESKV